MTQKEIYYNENMNLDSFSTVVDDRRYINPQVALDESNAFIENLRKSQGQRTEEIAQDTYNLGTAVPSNLGGLGGAGTYFTSRYQTPQTNQAVADLRAAAQAQALNDAMNNALAQAKQRYNNAYKAAQKRRGSNPTGPTNPTNPTNPTSPKLTIDTNKNGDKTTISGGGSDTVKENTWAGTPYKSSIYKYKKGDFSFLYDASSPLALPPSSSLASPLNTSKDGTLKTINGKNYISMNGNWYPITKGPF